MSHRPFCLWLILFCLKNCTFAPPFDSSGSIKEELFYTDIPKNQLNQFVMQKTTFHFLGLLFSAFLVLFVASCGDDTPVPTNTPPTITLAPDAGFVSFSQEVPFANPTFNVRVILDDGDNPLSSLTIQQDGSNVPTSNLVFDNGSTQAQNPFGIFGADQNGTSYDIAITPVAPMANGSATFTFIVTDSEQRRAETSLNITFGSTPATVTFGTAGLQDNQDRSIGNANFSLEVVATQGDALMSTIAFYQNDVLMSNQDVFTAGATISSNPADLGSLAALSRLYELRPSNVTEGPNTFRVDITDASGAVGSQFIVINYIIPEIEEISGVLLNQAGPVGTGGLDLDTGDGTGSGAAAAEIRDLGLDCTVPAPGLNWRRQIGTVNGAVMRRVDLSQLENFTFDNVTNLQQILTAHERGIELVDGTSINCQTGAQTTVTDVSGVLTVGDMFTVVRDNNTYLIRIDEINETATNNNDNYVISIKK